MNQNSALKFSRKYAHGRSMSTAGSLYVILLFMKLGLFSTGFAKPTLPEINSQRIDEIRAVLIDGPTYFVPPFVDREFWDSQRDLPTAQAALDAAAKFASEPIPEITEEMHGEFKRSGNRSLFEAPFSARARRLAYFTMAEGLGNDGAYVPLIEEELDVILSEPSWAVPAHTRRYNTWEEARAFIDLAAAARAWQVATVDWLLGDSLSQKTRERIRTEVRERVFAPYLAHARERNHGVYWWMRDKHNWNAVCNAGILGAALLLADTPEERAEFIAIWEAYSAEFLTGFEADGFCHEGIGYWSYGFGHFLAAAQAVRIATADMVNPFKDPVVVAIAEFGKEWQISKGTYPAFGDISIVYRPPTWMMDYISLNFGSGKNIHAAQFLHRHSHSPHQLYTAMLDLSLPRTTEIPDSSEPDVFSLRSWFPLGGALVSRQYEDGSGLAFAMKGGHNGQAHNHNDLGSFAIVHDGRLVLTEIGRDDYVRDTFGPLRYTSALMNSYGHPVPLVAGEMQVLGKKARAVSTETEFTDEKDVWVIDLQSAYAVPELLELTRTFIFSREGAGKIEIIDRVKFDSPQDFGTAVTLLSYQSRRDIGENRFLVEGRGAVVEVAIEAEGGEIVLSEEPLYGIVADRPQKGRRVGINFANPVTEGVIRTIITPPSDKGNPVLNSDAPSTTILQSSD